MDTAAGLGLQPRKRQRSSSTRPTNVASSRSSKAPGLILGEFLESDSAEYSAVAQRLNNLLVLPVDHQKFSAPTWEELANVYHSNLALVSGLLCSIFLICIVIFVVF